MHPKAEKEGLYVDFYKIKEKYTKDGNVVIYPEFHVCKSKDLMIRGQRFYAIYNKDLNLWSQDEYEVQNLIDNELLEYKDKRGNPNALVKTLSNFSSNSWKELKQYINTLSDNYKQLDERLTFSNTNVKKEDYVSRKLSYDLDENIPISNYNELINMLYDPDERDKIEWAIGSIISGDSKNIQKFIVLYGESGAGKSTVLNIVQDLFDGYYTTFEAKALVNSNNAFSVEMFKKNPLVAIQHDGDLSKIEDNTKLNSIVSHEEMTINEKHKSLYTSKINAFLFMGTNKPVKITDAKSGIIRRLIDVQPSGRRFPPDQYFELIRNVKSELGGIAAHCLKRYNEMGKNYYNNYIPLSMIYKTDIFFNFVEEYYYVFKEENGVSLKQAYDRYKRFCEDSLIDNKLPKYKFRDELKNYFQDFYDTKKINNIQVRNYYQNFLYKKFDNSFKKEEKYIIDFGNNDSFLDDVCKTQPAQYANESGVPYFKWDNVKTKLKDLDTSQLHYVKLPKNHIVIDFDLKNKSGEKDFDLNVQEASKFPKTYAEVSKSGKGIHLHYYYNGDVEKLARLYSENIEIKVFIGNSSLRRKLSLCNNEQINTISDLPEREIKMINFKGIENEKMIRALINKNLRKEIHPGTKPSIDFIHKILEDAYNSGVSYDVSDMKTKVIAFALGSTNQSEYCIQLTKEMKFKSENNNVFVEYDNNTDLVFFDVEVFPNLFVVCFKERGKGKQCVGMINPKSKDIENLLKFKLVGFNNKRYDNHILYAAYLGYNNIELFNLSQRIINSDKMDGVLFGEAYNLSYTDIYDFSSEKKSLKKFQIELGLNHKENKYKWDEPVPEDKWQEIVDYCKNDVITTEEVFENRIQDFIAREILADISGLTVNHSTQSHAEKIIFGDDKHPQDKFEYTDLSTIFPGYEFKDGKSLYLGEDPKEGGYVYAEPGIYTNVALLDIASMHPTSAIELNIFGPYTKNYEDLKIARLYIKHKEFDKAKEMYDGKLSKYLVSEEQSDQLSYALKIVINIVYGMTSAPFPNKFKDPNNIDNIVAKRGSLFMILLKNEVQKRGQIVAHIKTDSIKIPNPSKEIIDFIIDFGKKYGYDFEYEDDYEKLALVNDAVFIAKSSKKNKWVAKGAQFAHPYIYKKLFSKEEITYKDLEEVRNVTTSLHLQFGDDIQFIGKIGTFYPMKTKGGILLREKDGKYYAAPSSKGYLWMEAEMVKELNYYDDIDYSYYDALLNDAISTIKQYDNWEEIL